MGLPVSAIGSSMNLGEKWPCRDSQIRRVSALLSPTLPSPPTVVCHGPEATGKTGLLSAYLQGSGIKHARISCVECITGRYLLERTLAACSDAVHSSQDANSESTVPTKCESISSLASALEQLFDGLDKFVLVLDGIDEQREAPPTMLPALTRLGMMIPALTIVLVVTHPHPRLLHSPGLPHVYFSSYNREESVQILAIEPRKIFLEPPSMERYTEEQQAEDDVWVWTRFCAAVWDSLAGGAARDLVSFRSIADKLWRPFVQPIVDGNYGTRDFSKLLVSQRRLFQSENVLLDNVIEDSVDDDATIQDATHELPLCSKWLLCAAYLASFNPARQDPVHFMKMSERKRRKRGGGTAVRRESKARKIPRHLLSATPFPIDRLFAILHAILPHDLIPTIDVYTQLATLNSLRLLLRTAIIGGNILEPGGKWKVNFGRDYVVKLARDVGLDLLDYEAE
ncbi:hypothetical protein AAFC00_001310 [Neodothiora populina]|uniref:Orc1-like AAA ATPase domain-containing protein n=1 Tax=Neodothiora populina TaxID=2781224 RepID=A0ABR3PNI0_9PEZI